MVVREVTFYWRNERLAIMGKENTYRMIHFLHCDSEVQHNPGTEIKSAPDYTLLHFRINTNCLPRFPVRRAIDSVHVAQCIYLHPEKKLEN